MTRKLTSLSRKSALILITIVVAVIGLLVSTQKSKPVPTKGLAEYLNFGNSYVFSVPKSTAVDSQSLDGVELIYAAPLSGKTIEDVYNQNGIAIIPLALSDHSSKGFKDYVNGTYLTDLKKNLSTNDIKVKFGKANGTDNAIITVKKDGKQLRSIYLKGGERPIAVLAKSETDNFKVIEQTIKDVEKSDLKSENDGIRKSIQNIFQLAKAQKAQELYNAAAPELRSQTTQESLTQALKSASSFLDQNITVDGGSYSQSTFSSVLRFTPLNSKDNSQSTVGSMSLKKSDGQWKLQALSLPTPKQ